MTANHPNMLDHNVVQFPGWCLVPVESEAFTTMLNIRSISIQPDGISMLVRQIAATHRWFDLQIKLMPSEVLSENEESSWTCDMQHVGGLGEVKSHPVLNSTALGWIAEHLSTLTDEKRRYDRRVQKRTLPKEVTNPLAN